jgi:serine/threonine-protein kinase
MEIAPGTRVGGKYVLERELVRPHRGLARDRGSVWVANRSEHDASVAIKLLDPAYGNSPGFLHRFDRDLQAAAALTTRHAARVLDHGVEEDRPYVVMELLQGEDLAGRLLRHGRLPLEEAVRILTEAGDALRCAGAADLVHRGLRPESLFLAEVGDEEVVKILDFGVAKDAAPALAGSLEPATGAASLHYLSPEQIRAERRLDARADLWALGVILFRAVTGQLPFPGDVPSVAISQILLAPIPRATQLVPRLPTALDSFFDKVLARDRARRFRCAAEMIDELSRIAHLAPSLRPESSAGVPDSTTASGTNRLATFALGRTSAPPASRSSMPPARSSMPPQAAVTHRDARSILPQMSSDTQLGADLPDFLADTPAPPGHARRLLSLGAVAVLGIAAALTAMRLRGAASDNALAGSPASLPLTFAAAQAPVAPRAARVLAPAAAPARGPSSKPAAAARPAAKRSMVRASATGSLSRSSSRL